jgi:thiamine-monophosphate kinase
MHVAQLGEQRLIERLLRTLPPRRSAPRRLSPRLLSDLALGPGDDCAMVRLAPRRALLVTTDQLIEGTHFRWAWSAPAQLGERAAAVTLSDIGAMGGTPRWLFVSLGLPPGIAVRTVTDFYRGLRAGLRPHRVQLIGGDTSAAARFHAALTAIGEIDPAQAVTRAGARPGDLVMVTGTLGDAAAGLELLRRGARRAAHTAAARTLIRRQRYPTPRLAAGRALAEQRIATAMLDLSDGLLTDLGRLCRASRVGATLLVDQLPVSPALAAYGRRTRQDPLRFALAGGEDYELLFTVRPPAADRCVRLLGRLRLACRSIGTIDRAPSGAMTIRSAGRSQSLRAFVAGRRIDGFEHFRVTTTRSRP